MKTLDDLNKLYDTLNKFGLVLNEDQIQSLNEQEIDLIKREIVPTLTNELSPKLNAFHRDITLILEHHPEKETRILLSHQTVGINLQDSIQLYPEPNESDAQCDAAFDELHDQTDEEHAELETKKTPSKGLKVTFPDGEVIWCDKSVDTYSNALIKIGLERVSKLGITMANYNIVSHRKRTDDNKRWQIFKNGWYIYVWLSNDAKVKFLRLISEKLNLRLRIEEIKPL